MWNITESGKTIGNVGSENGEIVRDEEHEKGARLTLEKNGDVAPYAITSGVYGCFFHTTFLSTEKEGNKEFNTMKDEIDEFFNKDTSREEEYEWIAKFVERH